jgi:DNA-3-methyladenine glycosylase I
MQRRCPWSETHPLLLEYHDTEWGVPVHDDLRIFEFLVLESFQAGLSWLTILKKRENFRKSFHGFDPETIAGYGDEDISRLMAYEGIIRNRQKIMATIGNARAFLELQGKKGSFASWMWDFVDGTPIVNRWEKEEEIPPESSLSIKISKELKKSGFSFLGPVVVYSHMQAVGMINDHLTGCFRYAGSSPSSSRVSSYERSSTPARDSI